jgi:ABC-2 type transport system permease protein
LTTFLLAIPVLVAYIQVMNPDVFFYVKVLIILLLSPVVPLAFGAVIIMVIMAFVPFFKNRDLFNYASGFLALAFAIGINVVVGGTATLSQEKLLAMLTEGNNSLLAIFKFMFPNLPFAIQSLVDGSWISFILFIIITALVVFVFLTISKIVYFIGIIGVNETAAGRKQLNFKAYQKETSTKGAMMSYFLKEMRLMIRTPIYLLNNIATAFILPIIFLVSIGSSVSGEEEFSAFIKSIDWTNPDLLLIVSFAGLALGLMMSTLNLITPTALSREGSNIFFMKYIPMSYVKQIQAKIMSGLVVSFFGILFSLVAAVFLLKMHPIVIILILVMSIQGMIFMNYLGMIVDLIRPKLVWEQEAAAVKQNLNAAFTMIPAFALSFLPFLLLKYLPNNWFTVIAIFILFSFVNWMLIRLTTRMSITKLHELEV